MEKNPASMGRIAVLDTETNDFDEVMSIGIVVSEPGSYHPLERLYLLFEPECRRPAMYTAALLHRRAGRPIVTDRRDGMRRVRTLLERNGVTALFAYNARFDRSHLPELRQYDWYDIMRFAAYRQYNPAIDESAECCSTGRLKRNYGVEPILRLLSGDEGYHETHNAVLDAEDELTILRLLRTEPSLYEPARIK